MTEEEMQAAIDAANAERDALKAKNAELKSEKAKAVKAAEDAKTEAEAAAEEKARTDGNAAELEATLTKKFQKQIDTLTAERDTAVSAQKKLLIDNTIATDLVANNVAKPFHQMMTNALKSQAELKDGVAMIDDKPLSDYIKEFLAGDDGKHYVAAPANSGTGATGSKQGVTGTSWTKENFNMTEFSKLAKENPTEANSIAERLGMPYRA